MELWHCCQTSQPPQTTLGACKEARADGFLVSLGGQLEENWNDPMVLVGVCVEARHLSILKFQK